VAETQPTDQPAGTGLIPSSWTGRLGVAGVVWGLAMTAASVLSANRENDRSHNRPVQMPEAEQVTSDTCRSCHPETRELARLVSPHDDAGGNDGEHRGGDGRAGAKL